MKKAEIIKELENIKKELEMSPEEFCDYIKRKIDSDLKEEDVYTYRTGWIKGSINYILTH